MAESTQVVLERHLAALGKGLDAIMSDYTDDSVLITNDTTCSGLDEIRGFFDALLKFPKEVWDAFTMVRQEYVGDYGHFRWHAKPFSIGQDTFVVKDGKIVFQTVSIIDLQ